MKFYTIEKILAKLSPHVFKTYFELGLKKRNYKQLRTILFATMFGMAMVPLLLAGCFGYFSYKELLQKSEQEQVEWQLEGSIKSIEHMIKSLKSIAQFTAKDDRFQDLLVDGELAKVFNRVKSQHPLLADLGVIDQHGIQQAYAGNYSLQGTDYSDEDWFKEIFKAGVYVSSVYTGHRDVPHFAIAVGNYDSITQSKWVLRATIDATTLQKFINTIKTDATDDLFLVDNTGKLQTSSLYFGTILSQFAFPIEGGIQHSISDAGEHICKAIGAIDNSPWSLVLVKKLYFHHSDWKDFQLQLVQIMIISLIISLIVTFTLVHILTTLIRKSDDSQMAMIQDAEHTNKLASIGRLAAGVGHEINNPLAIIDQKVGLIEDLLAISKADFDRRDSVENSLQIVNQSVDRCKAITHRLLSFARRSEVSNEQLNVNEIIKEVIQFLDNAMLYNRIELNLDLDVNLPATMSDRLQLQQVFLNIVNNAIDAIEKNGSITIRSQEADTNILIIIEDNGPGIEEEILPNIFEPFYTTKETGKGTGLGLSITYGIIKKLGGDIAVKSQLGCGATFTITIPIQHDINDQQTEQHN